MASVFSRLSIAALTANLDLNFVLSTFTSPAATTGIGTPETEKDKVFAILHGSQPSAWAASYTVALETGNSRMRSTIPYSAKQALAFSMDTFHPPVCAVSLVGPPSMIPYHNSLYFAMGTMNYC